MKTANLFKTGATLAALVLTGCAGNPQLARPVETENGLIARCANKLDLCVKSGYDNFVAIGEGSTKQDAVNMAKQDIVRQIARYLHGSKIVNSQTSIRTSVGKSSELPKTDNYTTTHTEIRATRGKIPKIIWEWECSLQGNGYRCPSVGYIPK